MKITKWFMKKFFSSSRRNRQRSTPCRIPDIPHDVIVYIVNYLWKDPDALRACSLTCRTWHEAVQPLVFRSLTITNRERLSQLEKYIQRSPSVTSWVRSLDIDRSVQSGPVPAGALHTMSWLFDIAPKLADTLVNLTTLHFSHITEAALQPTPTFFHQLSSFSKVRYLSFTDCHLTDTVLFAFISAFPNIRTLHLHNHHRLAVVGRDVPILHPPHLTSLRVDIAINPFDTVTPLLQWLGTTPSVETLSSITFRNVPGTLVMDESVCVAEFVGAFLKKCVVVENLGLTFVDKNEMTRNDSEAELLQHFDLSHNTSLRTVELKDPNDGSLLPKLITSVSACPNINKVAIVVNAPPVALDHFRRHHSQIVASLGGVAFAEVDEVLLVNAKNPFDDILKSIYKPVLQRGIGRLVSEDDSHFCMY